MAGEPSTVKSVQAAGTLSARDKAILDAFSSGTSRSTLAIQHNLTLTRICQICKSPAAVAYLIAEGGILKALLYARMGGVILERSEWGGMRLTDLIAIWKAAMPQEVAVTVTDYRKAAERIAAEIGKPELVGEIERDMVIRHDALAGLHK